MTFRAFASEFPNDNPELHDGTSWICPEVLSGPKPLRSVQNGMIYVKSERASERRLARGGLRPLAKTTPVATSAVASVPVAASITAAPVVPVRENVEVIAAVVAPSQVVAAVTPAPRAIAPKPHTQASIPKAPDAFSDFVKAMVRVALTQNGSRAAAVLPTLLEQGVVASGALPEDTWRILEKRGFVAGHVPTLEFVATAKAWRDVLRGDSSDLGACGQNTLDRWASELLAALLPVPVQRAEDLRRELRRSGVAAFGMLNAA